jgi:hypothetical protein
MHEPDVHYAVELKIELPKLDSERQFLKLERQYIIQQLQKSDGESWRSWRPVKVSGLGVFRKQDWQAYEQALAHYERELDRYEGELEDGLIPFKIFVSNLGHDTDTDIGITVRVEDGIIHPARHAPERPERLDATALAVTASRPAWPSYSAFVRRSIKVGRQTLSAEFSQLKGGESAELIRQVLHVATTGETRLRYVIHSALVPESSGEVEIVED